MIEKRSWELLDLTGTKIVLVGEAESDARINAELAIAAGYLKPNSIFTGQYDQREDGRFMVGSNQHFRQILAALPSFEGFESITDIVLLVDATDDPDKIFKSVQQQITAAKGDTGTGEVVTFTPPKAANEVSKEAGLRVHVFLVPGAGEKGGLESLCIKARLEKLGDAGKETLHLIDIFVDHVLKDKGWSTEKKDKVRLQNLLALSHKEKPDIRCWECFNGAKPLISAHAKAFEPIRELLKAVAAGAGQ